MKKFAILTLLTFALQSLAWCLSAAENAICNDYPSLTTPGQDPELFSPGMVSDGMANRDIAITTDGRQLYYAVNLRRFEISTIMKMVRVKGCWSEPEVAEFARDSRFKYLEPAISPDGSRFFFVRADKDGGNNNDIWVMNKEGDSWGKPEKLGANINTGVSETFPSITNDGTLYFSRASEDPSVEHIYRARWQDGKYQPAERLPGQVNSGKTQFNAFVAPDEDYLIVSVYGREDSVGSVDYYIVYRKPDDSWSEPVNMGDKVNTAGAQEYSAYVSRDGRYLFFMSTRTPESGPDDPDYSIESLLEIHKQPENGLSDIYWMKADIIDELRPDGF